ncbi:MAG TPA: nucleoside hydrolase [Candidatus Didemnitutus sp.]|nr:nucleoside hydrolase [Candidatus Didemnitutus sp.]
MTISRTSRCGLGLACFCAVVAVALAAPRRKVIIDQDAFGPGGPNLQPILMVLQAADVEVLGITIESGDGWQAENTAHTLRMLELVARTEIPVAGGATFPLVNSEEETIRWEGLYGKLPYTGAWMREWPDYNTVNRTHYHSAEVVPPLEEGAPGIKPIAEPAAVFIARKVREFPGEVTILAMGPFTNLALASRLDEGFAAQAREIVFMGGSFNPRPPKLDEFALQFIHSPRVEFNSRWDPEAAKMMLHAGWRKITAVPLDATTPTKITSELLKRATTSNTPLAKYVARYAQLGFPMWDEVAAAVFLDPSVVKHAEKVAMDIEIDHGANYGATLSWPAGKGPSLGEPEVTAVLEIDVPKLEAMFVDLINKPAN